MKRKLFYVLAMIGLWQADAKAQVSLTPVLVGSAGDFNLVGNVSISSSVGEAAIITLGPTSGLFLTQGFQQPSSTGIMPLTVLFNSVSSTCVGANNGYGVASVLTGTPPYTYQWSSGGNADTTDHLPPGTYTVTVTDASGFTVTDSVVINEETANCDVIVYSGITPNGDGNNDTWLIDYIEVFPENEVNIFNRWGERVWHGSNYNNIDVLWRGTNQGGQPLPDGTYYYVINVNDKTLTGWVELTH
jgi:gliding motility-associated-like protein